MAYIEMWFFTLKGVFDMVFEALGENYPDRAHWDMDDPDVCA